MSSPVVANDVSANAKMMLWADAHNDVMCHAHARRHFTHEVYFTNPARDLFRWKNDAAALRLMMFRLTPKWCCFISFCNDAMFATHVRRHIMCEAHIITVGNIICRRQTSFKKVPFVGRQKRLFWMMFALSGKWYWLRQWWRYRWWCVPDGTWANIASLRHEVPGIISALAETSLAA